MLEMEFPSVFEYQKTNSYQAVGKENVFLLIARSLNRTNLQRNTNPNPDPNSKIKTLFHLVAKDKIMQTIAMNTVPQCAAESSIMFKQIY